MSDNHADNVTRSLTTPQGTLVLRPATPDDIPAFRALRVDAIRSSPAAFGRTVEETLGEPPEFWQNRVASTAQRVLLLAETPAGALAGMAGIVRGEGAKLAHGAKFISVYVDPAWRGLRLVDALFATGYVWAQQHGIRQMRLAVSAVNTPAIRVYHRCGFSVYGIDPEVINVNGVFYDELLMHRWL